MLLVTSPQKCVLSFDYLYLCQPGNYISSGQILLSITRHIGFLSGAFLPIFLLGSLYDTTLILFSNKVGRFFQIFVAFLEYLNFTEQYRNTLFKIFLDYISVREGQIYADFF